MFALHFPAAAALALAMHPQAAPPLQHPHETGKPPQQLGTVNFENSCDPAQRSDINRAVALLHSFWFNASASAFITVAEKDPSCGIAWWGVAMSRWGNPFAPARPVAALEQGRTAIGKAREAGAKTDRERDLIEAAAALFTDFEKVDHRTRTVSYEKAMETVRKKNPNDPEVAAFYALSVNQTMVPTDKTYAQQLKAAAILEELYKKMPDHPGMAHYLIHAYDHPPLAERALPAARAYAKIAPDAPHALHMPSHTFTRVGHWQDSIDTNRASADAARKANSAAEVLHAFDYQVYAYLQTAQDAAAQKVLSELKATVAAVNTAEQYGQVGYYADVAIPARIALERGDWAAAAALPVKSTNFPFIDAMSHYSRAIGAARGGNVAAAKADIDQLAALRDKLVAAKDEYWSQQVDIQHKAASAWVAFAEKRETDAMKLMHDAANSEDATDKSAISPGPLAPVREMLAEMLIEMKQAQHALVELEAVMKKEPNRFRTYYQAARAATMLGDKTKAAEYYRHIVDMCAKGDSTRKELLEARSYSKR